MAESPILSGSVPSSQQLHSSGHGAAVKGKGVLALGSVAGALDQAIREIGPAVAEFAQRLEDDFRSLDHEFLACSKIRNASSISFFLKR